MGIHSRSHAPRLTRPSRLVLASLLVVATLLGVVGPVAPWNDNEHDGHAEHARHAALADHASGHAEGSVDHGQCDAWSTTTAEHARHDGARFEPASQTRHHHHAAICGVCLHAAIDLPARTHDLIAVDPSTRSDRDRGETAADTFRLPRRSRAPPRA